MSEALFPSLSFTATTHNGQDSIETQKGIKDSEEAVKQAEESLKETVANRQELISAIKKVLVESTRAFFHWSSPPAIKAPKKCL